jgi:uncharacterized iron-regulated protein
MPEKVNGNKFSGKSNIESLNSSPTSIDSKSAVQLNSTENKLATLQKMADDSPYSQRFAHFTSMANNSIQKQPVSQLSKDNHSVQKTDCNIQIVFLFLGFYAFAPFFL